MKGGYTRLYDDKSTGDKVSEYADTHSSALPSFITKYHEQASSAREDSNMLSSNFQSKLHLFLAQSIGAKRGESVATQLTFSPSGRAVELFCHKRDVVLRNLSMLLLHTIPFNEVLDLGSFPPLSHI